MGGKWLGWASWVVCRAWVAAVLARDGHGLVGPCEHALLQRAINQLTLKTGLMKSAHFHRLRQIFDLNITRHSLKLIWIPASTFLPTVSSCRISEMIIDDHGRLAKLDLWVHHVFFLVPRPWTAVVLLTRVLAELARAIIVGSYYLTLLVILLRWVLMMSLYLIGASRILGLRRKSPTLLLILALIVTILRPMISEWLLSRALSRPKTLLLMCGTLTGQMSVAMTRSAQITIWRMSTALVKPSLIANDLSR